jgi:hypothetical protein
VVPNTGIVANADGVFVNSAYIATISANNASHLNGELPAYYTNATNISTGTLAVARGGTGVGTSTGTGSVVLSASPTFTGNAEFANIALTGVINANNSIGSAGQVLRTDGEGKAYWGPAVTAQDGTLTDINAGDGLVKGGTSTVPSLAVVANNGIIASTDGVFVKPHTGIIVNTDGVSVNAAYIATISANNASNFGGELPAYYTNASNISTGTLAVARGGTGATTFTAGALLKGNGNSAVSVASAADIVAAIGTTRVANATYADSSGSAGSATTATRATNSDNALVTNDNASSGTFYPVWVDATSGDRAIKIASTKLTFNPATGVLTATSFSGSGALLTALDAGNISTGTLPVARGGTGVTTSTGTTSVVLSASPTLTGTPLAPTATADTNSNQIATTAYVIGQGYLKSGTAASTYLPLAGGTVTGNLIVSGNLTIDGITTTVNSTTISVDDKNIELGSTASPSDAGADGGGITLKGTSDKTFNWVDATDAWTSSEHMNLLAGKAYYINGTSVLSSNSLAVGANVSANVTAFFVGNSTVNTFITQNLLDIGGQLNANGGVGTAGQVLVSGGAGNVYWTNQVVDTNTTYDLLSVANTTQGILRLDPSSGTDDDVFFVGQDEIAVSSNTTAVIIDHADVARSNNTSAASPASGGNFTAIDSITTNARGHVTAINTKTVTLPVDPNTTYDLATVANTAANEGLINLIGSNSTTDTGKIIGQDEIVVSSNPTAIYIDHADVARTNNTTTASPASGGTFTAIDSISTNARGHVTAINTKTVTLPVDPDTNTTYDLLHVANTIQGIIRLDPSSADANDDINFIGQDEIAVSSNTTAVIIDHADVARTNNTTTASPASGGTFTAIDSITTNARGHVTAINTKTVTLPIDPDTNTTYDLLTVANTTVGVVTLNPSIGANDDIRFIGAGGVTVTSDGNGNVTITGQTGDITAVTAGDGLTGGGTSGDVTLNIGAGNGITVNPDNVAVNTNDGLFATVSGLYVNASSISHGTLPVARGGTGGGDASTARTNLGATTVGGNLFTLVNPGAITFPRFNADNTVSALSATDFRTAIGAGTSSTTGTVTSVIGGTGLTGGTITASGTLSVNAAYIATISANNASFLGGIAAASYAPLANPTFTGTVSGITKAMVGLTNVEDKSSATIRGEITSGNVTTALGFTPYNATNPSGYITASSLSPYAPLANPIFTGAPVAPTAAADTNTTQLATTAYVVGQGYLKSSTASSTYAPLGGSGASGTWSISITGNAGTVTGGVYTSSNQTIGGNKTFTGIVAGIEQSLTLALSDETTNITTGTAKITFRAPFAWTLTKIPRASLSTASSSGTPTVDINVNGSSILSTKLTIDANETTSTTAATAAVLSSTTVADDSEITLDIDVAGTGAKGLKVTIFYKRPDPAA